VNRFTRSALCSLAVSAGIAAISPAPVQAAPLNILLILADDVGVEAFNSYGGTSYKTPNVTALAQSGRQYNYCYATPLCSPSRNELMTGLYNFRNYESFDWLNPDTTTFAEVFKQHGYSTAMAGKWQLSAPDIKSVIRNHPHAPNVTAEVIRDQYGFDQYSLWQLNGRGSRYWDPVIEQNGKKLAVGKDDYGPDLQVKFISDFMQNSVKDHKPFVAYYALELPHDPFMPTPDSPGDRPRKHDPANFADDVAYADKLVGQLVKKVHDLGVDEETLIIFVADNGTAQSITSQTTHGPVRGDKGHLTDAGTHVPLIIRWTGKIKPGETSDRIVDFTDFFPTLLSAAGIVKPPELKLDGKSLLGPDGGTGAPRETAYMWYDAKGRNSPTGEWARDTQFKLYADGRFFDTKLTPLERAEDQLSPVAGSPAFEARVALQKVLQGYQAQQTEEQKLLGLGKKSPTTSEAPAGTD